MMRVSFGVQAVPMTKINRSPIAWAKLLILLITLHIAYAIVDLEYSLSKPASSLAMSLVLPSAPRSTPAV